MKKPICPNESTPELPTNTYSATTIAAEDERVRELERARRGPGSCRRSRRARAAPRGPSSCDRAVRAPHTRSTAPCARRDEETGRSHEQHEDDEREDGRVEVDAARERPGARRSAGRRRASAVGEADGEAAERRAPEPVDAADDDADEHDDRVAQRVVGRDVLLLHRHDSTRRSPPARPRAARRSAITRVRSHAEQPGRPEVGRRRAHVQAEVRAVRGAGASSAERRRRATPTATIQIQRTINCAVADRAVQPGQRADGLAEHAELQHGDALQQEG